MFSVNIITFLEVSNISIKVTIESSIVLRFESSTILCLCDSEYSSIVKRGPNKYCFEVKGGIPGLQSICYSVDNTQQGLKTLTESIIETTKGDPAEISHTLYILCHLQSQSVGIPIHIQEPCSDSPLENWYNSQ